MVSRAEIARKIKLFYYTPAGELIQKDPIHCKCCGILCVKEGWLTYGGDFVGNECARKFNVYHQPQYAHLVKLTKKQKAYLKAWGALRPEDDK